MNYEYLMTHGNKRYYKFDDEITLDVRGEKILRPTRYVVISDATTHTERLVFPIFLVDGYTEKDLLNKVKGCIEIDYLQIAGDMTWMIHGGDIESIKPDDEYLQELINANTVTV